MLHKYKEAFSLIDEIDTCPNIEVEIDVHRPIPIFYKNIQFKEEDKALIGKEMKRYVI